MDNTKSFEKSVYYNFLDGKCSAKNVREIYEILNVEDKASLVNLLYSSDKKYENMKRLPPRMLLLNEMKINDKKDEELIRELLKYELVYIYNSLKTQNKADKLKKTICRLKSDSVLNNVPISHKYKLFSEAIRIFLENLIGKCEGYDFSKLNLPQSMLFGVELETVGFGLDKLNSVTRLLKEYEVDYLHHFECTYDASVKRKNEFGTEVITPILIDSPLDWEMLCKVCLFLKAIGGRTNKTCGGHVHFDANILGIDKPAWEMFYKIWEEVEPLMYMITSRKGEKTRAGVKDYSSMVTRNSQQINWNTVSIKSVCDLEKIATQIQGENISRYYSVNISNIGNDEKNTIEFRLANGTIDYNILRENILLFGRILQTAKMCSLDYKRKEEYLKSFFEKDIPEKEKIQRFLKLIMDDESEREIFYKRWESKAGEKPIFGDKSITTYKRQKRHSNKRKKDLDEK